MKLVYLAGPYTGQEENSFKILTQYAARLMLSGYAVFSPITHSHPIATQNKMPGSWEFWAGQDLAILQSCDTLMVLKMPGWEKSLGVTAEIKEAKFHGLEILYLDYYPIE